MGPPRVSGEAGVEPNVGKDMTTVLVVDDEFLIQTILADALEDEGFAVELARDGQAALDCVEKSLPSLIITDLMMPVMTGLELARALKQEPRTRAIPIILCSAAHTGAARAESHLFAAIYSKPFRLADLLRTVVRLADHSEPA
ncbi:response regulator [Marinivivus vitaminiproducens]|uniref:response regulator n=1 Tax=Marinivivus vitaminiproducens TaxID=3035935 RepID=UPI00279EB680|nr:response regulator [Geminicoccaceae bacterium SCSIO 64248]